MLEEFKKFALRGNVVDLAVGVIIGAAFGTIVASLVGDIIMPIIGAVTGGLDFSNYFIALSSNINASAYVDAKKQGAVLGYGQFLSVTLNFIIVAFVLFLVIRAMVKLQKQEEEKFEREMADKRATWLAEQKSYEEGLKKERSREEEEYGYQKTLRLKREKDAFEEEKRVWEREMHDKKQLHAEQAAELADLRKTAAQFPVELDKAIKTAVAEAVAEEKKDSQIRQNFAKQEWDAKQQLSALKITSLEQTVKGQAGEIVELKRQLEKAMQQVKDIEVAARQWLQRLLGRELQADEEVTVLVFPPHFAPSPSAR